MNTLQTRLLDLLIMQVADKAIAWSQVNAWGTLLRDEAEIAKAKAAWDKAVQELRDFVKEIEDGIKE
jgi:hypothetical protein